MACPRCGGLFVVEAFNDLREEGSQMWFCGSRCLNCGHIEDSVIRANRFRSLQPGLVRIVETVGGERGMLEWLEDLARKGAAVRLLRRQTIATRKHRCTIPGKGT